MAGERLGDDGNEEDRSEEEREAVFPDACHGDVRATTRASTIPTAIAAP
jgi:hypothetical protein